jgi:hypothetical protein
VDPSLIRWGQENVIAVRVYNAGDPGGFFRGPAWIGKPLLGDYASLSAAREGGKVQAVLETRLKTRGTVTVIKEDVLSGEQLEKSSRKVTLTPQKPYRVSVPMEGQVRVQIVYADDNFEDGLETSVCNPYILTPPAPAAPRYNGPLVFGVRPGSPVIFRLAFSGERPMKFAVEGLPEGVVLDADKGVLSGSCQTVGEYPLVLKATNDKGSAQAAFTLKVGAQIALTPPMGWNSWNCWGLSVSQEKVMASAAALINRGLADYGYSYINIDDAWEAEQRNPDGTISPNEKFPDMKALGDWLHANGLKLGIYSSPGDRTCGGYLGSLDHEEQDAKTWASWGVDYLKYDWNLNDTWWMKDMHDALAATGRDIVYSISNKARVSLGPALSRYAECWRTSTDIRDTWESISSIGFGVQDRWAGYKEPGRWPDADMLVLGRVGWGRKIHWTQLTPDEQFTHITLWSILASPLLIGCDMGALDDFTLSLLCNSEVIDVNQDPLGLQGVPQQKDGEGAIYVKPLEDGSLAVALFNFTDAPKKMGFICHKLGLIGEQTIRDLWRQQDIAKVGQKDLWESEVAPHGTVFLRISPGHTGERLTGSFR